MTTMNQQDIDEINQVVRAIEEAVSGHRSRIVLLAIEKVKGKVMEMSVYKRPNDK